MFYTILIIWELSLSRTRAGRTGMTLIDTGRRPSHQAYLVSSLVEEGETAATAGTEQLLW